MNKVSASVTNMEDSRRIRQRPGADDELIYVQRKYMRLADVGRGVS